MKMIEMFIKKQKLSDWDNQKKCQLYAVHKKHM